MDRKPESSYVGRVKNQRIRRTFRSTPERLTRTCDSIFGKAKQELADIVIVIPFELKASPNNAFFKGKRLVRYEIGDNLLNLFPLLTGIFKGTLQIIGFRKVSVNRLGRFDEKAVELCSAPLSSKIVRKVGIERSTITSIV